MNLCSQYPIGRSVEYSLLLEQFQRHVWQPFTQMKLAPKPVLIEKGKGARLYTKDGKELIDAIGSWWVNIHGHSHPYINEAVSCQLQKFEHAIFAGLSHEPGIELAFRLAQSTQGQLPRVYYSDNGSTAVEIALKMAFQFFYNQGQPEKREFVSLSGGYHGDTIGCMSVGARGIFHEAYAPLLFPCHSVHPPRLPFEDFSNEKKVELACKKAAMELEELLLEHANRICGFILEPLVQAASSGFAMYPSLYLKQAREICKKYNVFLIADEVFTGHGRTGSFYAFEKAGVWPDILATSKGLSAGYLPFAATLCSEEIFAGFYSDDRSHTLFHGHSMTGNPLGCAAALASLELFERENSLEKVHSLEAFYTKMSTKLQSSSLAPYIQEIRILGSIFVLELGGTKDYTSEFGWRFMQRAIEKGVLLRPLGRSIYLTPPYCIAEEELQHSFGVLTEVLLEMLC